MNIEWKRVEPNPTNDAMPICKTFECHEDGIWEGVYKKHHLLPDAFNNTMEIYCVQATHCDEHVDQADRSLKLQIRQFVEEHYQELRIYLRRND